MGDREPVWNLLTRILEFVPVLPPKVAGAVFTLASEQPGVTLLPHVTDAAGQPGIGITKAGDPSHVELIFDPRTYQLEGINVPGFDLTTPQGPVAGAHSMAIVHTAVVNSRAGRVIRAAARTGPGGGASGPGAGMSPGAG